MNAFKSCMAAIAAPVLVAGALAFGPVQASAQEITGDDTATTEVTIAAAAGLMAWAIKKEGSENGKEAADDGDA